MFLKYDIKVRIGQKEASFGKGVIELMEGVERTGSLSAAYKAMNMSSSKAWKIIQRAQQDLGIVLFESKRVGADGGHTIITAQGKELMRKYRSMMLEVERQAEISFQKYFTE